MGKNLRKTRIEQLYNLFRPTERGLFEDFYAAEVEFADPLVNLQGREALWDYYKKIYRNVTDISFEFTDQGEENEQAWASWIMRLRARGLNQGRVVEVVGASFFRFAGEQVIFQRDYYDMGAMIYEHLPLLRRIIAYIKRRMT